MKDQKYLKCDDGSHFVTSIPDCDLSKLWKYFRVRLGSGGFLISSFSDGMKYPKQLQPDLGFIFKSSIVLRNAQHITNINYEDQSWRFHFRRSKFFLPARVNIRIYSWCLFNRLPTIKSAITMSGWSLQTVLQCSTRCYWWVWGINLKLENISFKQRKIFHWKRQTIYEGVWRILALVIHLSFDPWPRLCPANSQIDPNVSAKWNILKYSNISIPY